MALDMETILGALGAVKSITAGATSLTTAMAKEIGLVEIIDKSCECDRTRCKVSPGNEIFALAICILSDRKAFYRVEEFCEGKDVEALFGAGLSARDFNDDVLGTNLDKLFNAGGNRVLGEVVASTAKVHDAIMDSIHFDTTSLSACGKYRNQDRENAIEVVLAYSKDRSPNLEQIQFGIGVTCEGILNYGEALSGNSSDKTWNKTMLSKVKTMFPPEALKDMIYVANCSFITEDNLKVAGDKVKFISRMPATFGVVSKVIREAWMKMIGYSQVPAPPARKLQNTGFKRLFTK